MPNQARRSQRDLLLAALPRETPQRNDQSDDQDRRDQQDVYRPFMEPNSENRRTHESTSHHHFKARTVQARQRGTLETRHAMAHPSKSNTADQFEILVGKAKVEPFQALGGGVAASM